MGLTRLTDILIPKLTVQRHHDYTDRLWTPTTVWPGLAGSRVTDGFGLSTGWYDRPGRVGDFGQLLRDIRRLPGCQRQIPGRSVRGNERLLPADADSWLVAGAGRPLSLRDYARRRPQLKLQS
jgi:hypothetical protein